MNWNVGDKMVLVGYVEAVLKIGDLVGGGQVRIPTMNSGQSWLEHRSGTIEYVVLSDIYSGALCRVIIRKIPG